MPKMHPPGPKTPICPQCGTLGQTRIHTPGSILIELVLWLCFIIPGLVYSIWRHTARREVCKACGNSKLLPVGTPAGQKLLQDMHSGQT